MNQKRPLWQTMFTLFSLLLLQYQFLFISPSTVSACSCMELNEAEAFNYANGIFRAKVVEIVEPSLGGRTRSVLFEVSESWKGVDESYIVLETGLNDGDCGYNFKIGNEYIVYANLYEGDWSTSICSGTFALSSSGPGNFLEQLQDRATVAVNPVPIPSVSGNDLALYIGGGVVLVVVAFFLMRKRMTGSN